MPDPTASEALPTPEQMRKLQAASAAARQARRMREASRSVITGGIVGIVCVIGVGLVLIDTPRMSSVGPFATCGLAWGYLLVLFVMIRRWMRQRARSTVKVVDPREREFSEASKRPGRDAKIVLLAVVFQVLTLAGWNEFSKVAAERIPLASLALGPIIFAGCCVARYALYRFWEDLLFAACVGMAYAPFFLQAWSFALLSPASLVGVVVGTVCLDRRWEDWARSLPPDDGDPGDEEAGA